MKLGVEFVRSSQALSVRLRRPLGGRLVDQVGVHVALKSKEVASKRGRPKAKLE